MHPDSGTMPVNEAPLRVDLLKINGSSTLDRPLWARPEFLRLGGRVAIAQDVRHSLYASTEGVLALSALVSDPLSGSFLPSAVVAPAVDASINSKLNQRLIEIGVATLWNPSYEDLTTKNDTRKLASMAAVGSPRSFKSVDHNNDAGSIFNSLTERGVNEVVLKPVIGCQGEGVIFHKIRSPEKFNEVAEKFESDYVVEERVMPPPLVIEGVAHDWNFRIVVIEGVVTNYYVRASSQDGPVNISTGAFLLPWEEAFKCLPADTDLTESVIKSFGLSVGKVLTEGVIGVDAILDGKDGALKLIEVNAGHVNCMGDPDRDIFSQEEKLQAMTNQVVAYRKIGDRTRITAESDEYIDLTPDLTVEDFLNAIEVLHIKFSKNKTDTSTAEDSQYHPAVFQLGLEVYEALTVSSLETYEKEIILTHLMPFFAVEMEEDFDEKFPQTSSAIIEVSKKLLEYRSQLSEIAKHNKSNDSLVGPVDATSLIEMICTKDLGIMESVVLLMYAYDQQPFHTLLKAAASHIVSKTDASDSAASTLLRGIKDSQENLGSPPIDSLDSALGVGVPKLVRMISDPGEYIEDIFLLRADIKKFLEIEI